MKPVTPQSRVKDFPPTAISMANTLFNKTGSWRTFRPVYDEKLPPCNVVCPAGERIQKYLYLVKTNKIAEAWQILKQDNPFPSVCGRVCFHPCETECNRGDYDEPIGIHYIERFIGDYGLRHNLQVKKLSGWKRDQVAIIGGGPAGLACGYHLARLGYQPTIFESAPLLGGMLQYGIPKYRLPKDILQEEIKSIIKLGIKVKTKTMIGKDISFDEIARKFDAVFIASGASKERELGIPGEDARGVLGALDFLRQVNRKIKLGQKVVVIGGGNAALDAVRSARRLGMQTQVIYRRTRNEMPAIPDEIGEAEEEKISFIFLAAPVKIITRAGRVTALECLRMKLGAPDASGRRKPIPIKGSNFTIKTDAVIKAIGEEVETSFLPDSVTVKNNTIVTNKWGETSQKGIFAGGDAATGPKTVVEAIGSGKRTAFAIDKYLRTGQVALKEDEQKNPVRFNELNTAYLTHAPRVPMAHLELTQRVNTFKEIYTGYSPRGAATESERCFSCGVCNFCDNCWVFCPDMSVIKRRRKYEFNYDYCKGCGICATECPRNVISLVEEKK